jgi:hypothetical protein
MYKLLGMLDEYISRFSYVTGEPYPNLVEFFYPSETDLADYFENLILEYRAESKINIVPFFKVERELTKRVDA